MKKAQIIFNIAVVAALAAMATFYFKGKQKVAYVDSGRVAQEYKGMQAAQEEYKSKLDEWNANLDTLQKELEAFYATYKKDSINLSNKEHAASWQHIDMKQKEMYQYQQAMSQKAAGFDQELTNKVAAQINKLVQEFGKDKGYSIIIAATNAGNVLYANDAIDVTDELIEALNNEY